MCKYILYVLMLFVLLTNASCAHYSWQHKGYKQGAISYLDRGMDWTVKISKDAAIKEIENYCGSDIYRINNEYANSSPAGYYIGQMGNMYYAQQYSERWVQLEFTCEGLDE